MNFEKRIDRLKEWEREARPAHRDDSTENERKREEVAAAYYQRELQDERAALVRAERERHDRAVRNAPSAMALAFAKARKQAK